MSSRQLLPKPAPSHSDLIEVAYAWVLKSGSCGVAFKELNTLTSSEYPDVIGFGSWGHSVLLEVKTSRSDFQADKKKAFRKNPVLGMGSQRFYLVPKNLITIEELPAGWGLIYVDEVLKTRCVHNPFKANKNLFTKNIIAEHGLMYSALRRLHLRGLIDQIYKPLKLKRGRR